ncbi:MAG: RIP metalloprotease RseP [Candidatus Omnitrophota bacterium]|nr:RIP metalloprotease RseP [Candidatus Omnitrophota bacterium]
MFTLLIFIFILSILIFVHELGHFLLARRMGVRVEKFSLGFGPAIWTVRIRGTEYCLSAVPLGGYVKMAGDSLEEFKGAKDEYFSQNPGKRFWILSAGSLVNYLAGFLLFWLIFFIGYPAPTAKVGGLLDDFGAKAAGLQVGDKIIAVDGQKIALFEELQGIIQQKKAQGKVTLLILRGSQEKAVEVPIKEKEAADLLGQKLKVGLLGVTPSEETITVKHGVISSLALGAQRTWFLTVLTYKGIWYMLTGKLSMRESVTGLPGIFMLTSKAARAGAAAVLNLMAVLTISLGLFNLLPFPVLDGGHILLLGLEKLRRRPLSIKADHIVNQIGITLLVTLVIFVTYNDLMRFFVK